MSGEGVDDTINLGTAARLLSGERPLACCPHDGEPLVATMEFPRAEFFCQVCRRQFGFLAPSPRPSTPALEARHAELKAAYDLERAERAAAAEGQR